jgi:bacteriocin-like protein
MIPTEIIPVTELTDTELDAVSGGLLNNLNIIPQINIGVPIGVAVGGVGAGSFAAIGQLLGQTNGVG